MSADKTNAFLSAQKKRPVPRQWKRHVVSEVQRLSEDAPIGQYNVDSVAQELFVVCGKSGDATEFVKRLRHNINAAADRATTAENYHFNEHPPRFDSTKLLFQDLKNKHFQNLLKRVEKLRSADVVVSHKRIRGYPAQRSKHIDDLLTTLQHTRNVITVFLDTYKPQGNPGNHGPRLRVFMQELFDLWQDVLWTEGSPPEESQLFIRLVAAAWRDYQFPMEDQKGQFLEEQGKPLEEWIGDRLRKQFPEGIQGARKSVQYEAVLRAFDRDRTD
jgi:hypothetical protein